MDWKGPDAAGESRLKGIGDRLEKEAAAHLTRQGAVRVLEWAGDCAEGGEAADLLALFAAAGGMEIIRYGHDPLQ